MTARFFSPERTDKPTDPPAVAAHDNFVRHVRISPAGSRLVTIASDFVGLWSVGTEL
jgi:hypothetical protein